MEKETIRILHCIPTLGGGGAERQASYLAEALAKRGGDVHVAYIREGPNLDRLYGSGVTLHKLPCSSNYDPRILYELLQVLNRIKPDLVQTWLRQMNILGGLAATFTGIPFVVSERSCSMAYRGTWKDWLRGHIAQRAAAIVANSQGGKTYWMSRTLSPLEVIQNGIPMTEIAEVSQITDHEAKLQNGAELILFAGRYAPEKNLGAIVDALGKVLSCRESAVAVLFGEGPLRNDIVNKVNAYRLGDRLRVLDFNTRLWSWMKRANVFVSVSLYEGNPNTVLEAMACGSPLVLSDIPPHREFLDDDSAYFVSASAASKIAEGILCALRDPGEAKRRAQRAWRKISPCSVEVALDQYLALYTRTVKQ
jgi:glycosyltransferase involved in cell wall biosynthesis